MSTVEGRAAAAADAWLTHGDPESMNTHLERLATVSGEDIAKVFSERTDVGVLHYLPEELS